MKIATLFSGIGSPEQGASRVYDDLDLIFACENLTRKARLMELDEKYAQVIIQRYCDYTSIDKIKINGKEVLWSEYKDAN